MSVLQGSVYVAELVADSDLTAATVTCTVTAPDLTVTTPTVTVSTTTATAPVPAAMPGTYVIVWQSSGTVIGTQQDQFTCIPVVADLISLPDLKEELKIAPTDTREDAWLRRKIRSAANVIEDITGPIRPYPQTDYFDGGTVQIVLMARWVSAIGSVQENWSGTDYTLTEQPVGASVDSYGYTWDRDTNTLTRRFTGGQPTVFFPGVRNVAVTYTGGLTSIPENIQDAAAELVRHWRNKERGYQVGPYGGNANDDQPVPGMHYSIPNAVLELVEPWRRPPGIY